MELKDILIELSKTYKIDKMANTYKIYENNEPAMSIINYKKKNIAFFITRDTSLKDYVHDLLEEYKVKYDVVRDTIIAYFK